MELDFKKYKAQQFCDNPDCDYYRKIGENNIRTHSCLHHQVYCNTCKQIWVVTIGTFFYNLKALVSLILEILKLLSEGMGLRAVCRSKGVTPNAVSAWVLKAAKYVNEVAIYFDCIGNSICWSPESLYRVRIREVGENAPMKADEGWTQQVNCGKTASLQTCQYPGVIAF